MFNNNCYTQAEQELMIESSLWGWRWTQLNWNKFWCQKRAARLSSVATTQSFEAVSKMVSLLSVLKNVLTGWPCSHISNAPWPPFLEQAGPVPLALSFDAAALACLVSVVVRRRMEGMISTKWSAWFATSASPPMPWVRCPQLWRRCRTCFTRRARSRAGWLKRWWVRRRWSIIHNGRIRSWRGWWQTSSGGLKERRQKSSWSLEMEQVNSLICWLVLLHRVNFASIHPLKCSTGSTSVHAAMRGGKKPAIHRRHQSFVWWIQTIQLVISWSARTCKPGSRAMQHLVVGSWWMSPCCFGLDQTFRSAAWALNL